MRIQSAIRNPAFTNEELLAEIEDEREVDEILS